MKRTIVLIAIAAITLLLLPIALFSAPKDYLGAEGSSYGLIISQEAKQEAMQARADRLLLYQDEINALGGDSLGLQASAGGSASIVPAGSFEILDPPVVHFEHGKDTLVEENDFTNPPEPADGDAGSCGKLGCDGEGRSDITDVSQGGIILTK